MTQLYKGIKRWFFINKPTHKPLMSPPRQDNKMEC